MKPLGLQRSGEAGRLLRFLLWTAMPNRPWTSTEQRDFLQGYTDKFESAQQDDELAAFFPPIYEAWEEKWPRSLPSQKFVDKHGDRAQAEWQRFWERVSPDQEQ